MSDEQDTGPSFETLMKLRDALPSLAKGLAHKKIGGKGKPVIQPTPRKTCSVCCKMFDYVTVEDPPAVVAEPCEDCAKMLKDGCVAIVAGDRYAFVKSKLLEDMAGQIMPVSPYVLEHVNKHFQAEWKMKENNGQSTPS